MMEKNILHSIQIIIHSLERLVIMCIKIALIQVDSFVRQEKKQNLMKPHKA